MIAPGPGGFPAARPTHVRACGLRWPGPQEVRRSRPAPGLADDFGYAVFHQVGAASEIDHRAKFCGNLGNCEPAARPGCRSSFWAGSMAVRAGVAQLVEHLICNQTVGGSSPFASSSRINHLLHFNSSVSTHSGGTFGAPREPGWQKPRSLPVSLRSAYVNTAPASQFVIPVTRYAMRWGWRDTETGCAIAYFHLSYISRKHAGKSGPMPVNPAQTEPCQPKFLAYFDRAFATCRASSRVTSREVLIWRHESLLINSVGMVMRCGS